MKKRGLLLLATCAWLLAPATARAVDYDTSGATISCTTLIGTVGLKPTLTLTPQPDTELTLKGTLGGCTVSGAIPADPPLQVVSGKLTAKLTVPTASSCATLISGFQALGNFVFKWKTASGQNLDFPASTFTPDAGGLVAGLVPVGVTTYGGFSAAGTLAAGSAFAGATPAFLVVSGEDIYNMFGQCCTDATMCTPVGKGIKKLHISIGQIVM
jgi:hypothetical protein